MTVYIGTCTGGPLHGERMSHERRRFSCKYEQFPLAAGEYRFAGGFWNWFGFNP